MPIALDLETDLSLETLALHAGSSPDPATGALLTPIYQSTTLIRISVGLENPDDVINDLRHALEA